MQQKYYQLKTDSKCSLCQKYDKAIHHWCKHVPELAKTCHEGKVLQNQQGQTDRTIPKNILGITNHDNEKQTYKLLHGAISGDRNVINKEVKKILKYQDPTIETECIWNAKTEMIPLIMGANEPYQNHSENT
jgi:hypothetical protein